MLAVNHQQSVAYDDNLSGDYPVITEDRRIVLARAINYGFPHLRSGTLTCRDFRFVNRAVPELFRNVKTPLGSILITHIKWTNLCGVQPHTTPTTSTARRGKVSSV